MIVIGLTGGIASGKSFVAGLLAERGAVVLDADRHAHAALDESEIRQALVDRWGEAILDSDGSLRRDQIAARVFGDDDGATAERRFLEGLIHPRVRARLQEDLEAARSGGAPAAVLDIPLLMEAGWAEQSDLILFVETPTEIRVARAADRGWSADELHRREAAQQSLDDKKSAADVVLPGAEEAASRQAIQAAWESWVGSAGGAGD